LHPSAHNKLAPRVSLPHGAQIQHSPIELAPDPVIFISCPLPKSARDNGHKKAAREQDLKVGFCAEVQAIYSKNLTGRSA
jgi:hypothetical protein